MGGQNRVGVFRAALVSLAVPVAGPDVDRASSKWQELKNSIIYEVLGSL